MKLKRHKEDTKNLLLRSVAVLRCGKTVLRCGFVAALRVIYVHTAIAVRCGCAAVRIRNIAAASRDAVRNLKPCMEVYVYFTGFKFGAVKNDTVFTLF
ncbi:hypothetical protein QL285_074298 [Trifolium repens]|nr:hypothetical protein QL285_074298 [Trifolium repens]